MERTILHCDLNGFFASVELLSLPELVGKPMAVCGDPDSRHGVILAKNEHAKKYGVNTAETVWQAKRKCPDLVLVPSHHKEYARYSRLANEIYCSYTNQVEPFGIDESWLDPLPASALLYVGKVAEKTLSNIGVHTIGQLGDTDLAVLSRLLGKSGEQLHRYALGLDNSPVAVWGEGEGIKSVGNGLTFRRNLEGLQDIKAGVYSLADTVAARLRDQGLSCTTLQVQIRNPEFHSISRQMPLSHPTHLAREIAEAALQLILKSWDLHAPIRMLTITGTNLVGENCAEQTSLFEQQETVSREKQEKLERAMDQIRGKYGNTAIATGNTIDQDL